MSETPDNNSDSTKSQCGRKKGCVLEEINLRSGGVGQRPVHDSIPWNLERYGIDSDSDFSKSSSESEENYDSENLSEKGVDCVSNLEGNRLLPIGKVVNAISNSMCCSKCALSNHKALMNDFIDFCSAYKENITKEENEKLFYSKFDRLEWRAKKYKTTKELYHIYNGSKSGSGSNEERLIQRFNMSEQTMGIATSILGFCSRKRRPHVFRIDADTIKSILRSSLHHHARGKLYAANYQLAAAIQQMGCGPADIMHLCGFLSLPSGSIQYHIRRAEEIMGPIQVSTKEAFKRDAIREEIEATKSQDPDGLKLSECKIDGHQHPPLPKLKGSYGMDE